MLKTGNRFHVDLSLLSLEALGPDAPENFRRIREGHRFRVTNICLHNLWGLESNKVLE